jgi:WD40 repeat protein
LQLEPKTYRDFTDPANYNDRLKELLADITSGRGGATLNENYRDSYVTAPPLPVKFVERSEELAGLRAAVIADAGTRHIVLAASGQLLTTLQGHRGRVISPVFSRDGEHIATTSRDKTARVFRRGHAFRSSRVAGEVSLFRTLHERSSGAFRECKTDRDYNSISPIRNCYDRVKFQLQPQVLSSPPMANMSGVFISYGRSDGSEAQPFGVCRTSSVIVPHGTSGFRSLTPASTSPLWC